MTMTSSRFRPIEIAFVSDIHLAHPRTETPHIVTNLRNVIDEEFLKGLDILFFAGDVFDRLMNLPQEEVDIIQEWIGDTLKLCVAQSVRVRVLEGTPSHDWRQSKQFVNINETLHQKADLRYWETLGIEIFDDLGGLSVLYVPDEWNDESNVTLDQVREVMAAYGLTQVDVACMHGSFDYQLPIMSVKNHDSRTYLSLVKHYIGIGHVHLRSEYSLPEYESVILAQGSFDRLSHGEEAPKGLSRASIGRINKHWFVENKGARIYKTMDCRDMELDKVIELIEAHEELPDKSRFRLLISRGSVVQLGMKDIRSRFPQFIFSTQMDELKATEDVNIGEKKAFVKPISINPTNVVHLVAERLKAMGETADTDYALSVLSGFVNE